jgi:hypothetical protein
MDSLLIFIRDETVILVAGIACASLLFFISVVHLYWSWGGRWGLKAAVPTLDGKPVFGVSPMGTFAVFFSLLVGGLLILGRIGLFGSPEPAWIYEWAPWFLAFFFALRVIGDFRFMGMFKKIRFTFFSWWDSYIFIPVSIMIVVLCIIVGLSPGFKVVQ